MQYLHVLLGILAVFQPVFTAQNCHIVNSYHIDKCCLNDIVGHYIVDPEISICNSKLGNFFQNHVYN